MGHKLNAFIVLNRKPEANCPLKRYRHKWEDNTKIESNRLHLSGLEYSHCSEI
jgi:hypothetical protein